MICKEEFWGKKLSKINFSTATKAGDVEIVKYLHENHCDWGTKAFHYAAENGHVDCLVYAHENGFFLLNKYVCEAAARCGQLECLRYLHDITPLWIENGTLYYSRKCKNIKVIQCFPGFIIETVTVFSSRSLSRGVL